MFPLRSFALKIAFCSRWFVTSKYVFGGWFLVIRSAPPSEYCACCVSLTENPWPEDRSRLPAVSGRRVRPQTVRGKRGGRRKKKKKKDGKKRKFRRVRRTKRSRGNKIKLKVPRNRGTDFGKAGGNQNRYDWRFWWNILLIIAGATAAIAKSSVAGRKRGKK